MFERHHRIGGCCRVPPAGLVRWGLRADRAFLAAAPNPVVASESGRYGSLRSATIGAQYEASSPAEPWGVRAKTPMSPTVGARTERGPRATAEHAPISSVEPALDPSQASRTDTWRLVLVVTVP